MTIEAASSLQIHVSAFMLAAASSTDNFMVGITAALSNPTMDHFYRVNLVVALCNACGTMVATYCGDHLKRLPEIALMRLAETVSSSSSPETYQINFSIGNLLAAIAFAYLAYKEYSEEDAGDADEKETKKSRLSYSIALPMTLNNLAGGVAGGALGISAFQGTVYAFSVSVGAMALGHTLASRMLVMHHGKTKSQEGKDSTAKWCKIVAVVIYLLLSIQSLTEV